MAKSIEDINPPYVDVVWYANSDQVTRESIELFADHGLPMIHTRNNGSKYVRTTSHNSKQDVEVDFSRVNYNDPN